ncbi:MAG: hypothetical protein K1W21_15715 [Oscillospiraceae bacterium]
MNCVMVVEDVGQLTGKLLNRIHEKCGFRRLFIRQRLQPDGDCDGLRRLGFAEHQRTPLTQVGGAWIPLLLQPYGEAQAYEAVFSKTFP